MKKDKRYIVLARVSGDKIIIDRFNKFEELTDWLAQGETNTNIKELTIYEREDNAYVQTYFRSKRAVGF